MQINIPKNILIIKSPKIISRDHHTGLLHLKRTKIPSPEALRSPEINAPIPKTPSTYN